MEKQLFHIHLLLQPQLQCNIIWIFILFWTNFSYLIPKGKQYGWKDDDKLTEMHLKMVFYTCHNTECGWPFTSLMEVIIVPLVRGVQFVSRALLASYCDRTAGCCCSSKITN